MDYFVKEYGSAGDGAHNDTGAVQAAINACAGAGGGRVVVGSGQTHLIQTIHIKSNVELHIQRGGRLLLWPEFSGFEETGFPGPQRFGVCADGAVNIAISGGGEIDGNGRAYIAESLEQIYRTKRPRPFMFGIVGCNNVSVKDIRIVDAPCWTIHLSECHNVLIDGVSVLNDMKMPNSDGIDIDRCRYVRVSNCHLECGDDCIVLKCHQTLGTTEPCENITVSNCTMTSRSFAVNLGCEVGAPIRNCVFQNCVIADSHRGIGVHLSQGGDIENVVFSNFIIETRYYDPAWWGAAEPIYVVSIPWTKNDTVGHVKNIVFDNILCRSENGVVVYGDDGALIDHISFRNVCVELTKFSDVDGGRFDLRPCEGIGIDGGSGVFEHDTSGFFIRNAKNVSLKDCSVIWGKNRPDYFGYALDAHGADHLSIDGFCGSHARGESFDGMRVASSQTAPPRGR